MEEKGPSDATPSSRANDALNMDAAGNTVPSGDAALIQDPPTTAIRLDETPPAEGMDGTLFSMEGAGPSHPSPSSSGDCTQNVSAKPTAPPETAAVLEGPPISNIQEGTPLPQDVVGAQLATEGAGPTEHPLSLISDCLEGLTTKPAAAPKTSADLQEPQMPMGSTEETPLEQDVNGATLSEVKSVPTNFMPSSSPDTQAAVPDKATDLQGPPMAQSQAGETPLAEDKVGVPLATEGGPSSDPLLCSNADYTLAVNAGFAVASDVMAVNREFHVSKSQAETPFPEEEMRPPSFIEEVDGELSECLPISGAVLTVGDGEPAGPPRRAVALRAPPGFESLEERTAHTQGAVGRPPFAHGSDESDQDVVIRVEDLDVPRMPREAAKQRAQQRQHQEPPPPKIFEPLYWTMQRFVSQFSKVHVERERAEGGVSVCVVCRAARSMLFEIQEFVKMDTRGREFVLSKASFMSALVDLCRVSSPRSPSICAITGPDIQEFVERRGYCSGGSLVTLVEGQLSDMLWERFLGEAAKKVKRVTYMVRTQPPVTPGNEDSSEREPSDEAVSASDDAEKAETKARCGPSSLDVAGCLDARHLWIYKDAAARANIRDRLTAETKRALARGPRKDVPVVGEIAGLAASKDRLERVLVLEVCGETAVVWFMDRGNFCKVRWSELIPLGAASRALPPTICLAILADVKPMPFVGLLKECVKLLRALTNHFIGELPFHLFMVTKMTSHGAVQALVELLNFPDYETRMASIRCLSQMCRRLPGRHAICKAGCVMKVMDRLRKAVSEHPGSSASVPEPEKQSLITLLQAVFFRNYEHIHELADTDMVAVIYKVLASSPANSVTHRLAQFCLRCVLDSGYKERRLNVRPRQFAMTPEELDGQNYPVGGSTGIQQHGVFTDTLQRVTSPPEVAVPSPAAPVGEVSGQASPATAAPPLPVITSTGVATAPPLAPSPPPSGGRFYAWGSVLPLKCDATRELLPVTNIKMASARKLAVLACSFLNAWRPCTIFYGVSPEGQVRGVALSPSECKTLNIGFNHIVGNLRPKPPPGGFAVEFVPVLRSASQLPQAAVVSHYVVEVSLRGVARTVYTTSDGDCFLRRGNETYQANTFEVRSWVVQKEEEFYLRQAAAALREEGADDSPSEGPGKRAVGGRVAVSAS